MAIPSSALSWTSTAYLLWDDFDATLLTTAQQESLLDWLHWGGQLIVANPRSLDTLKGTFLAPYLPAVVGEPRGVRQADFDALNGWIGQVSTSSGQIQVTLEVPDDSKVEWFALQPDEGATAAPGSGGLVIERPIGTGRVVVTAVALDQLRYLSRADSTWTGLDCFWNAFLLARPGRDFFVSNGVVGSNWKQLPISPDDARINTRLRYFARDVDPVQTEIQAAPLDPLERRMRGFRVTGYAQHPVSGVASWNDQSGSSEIARQILNESSGIDVPSRQFVASVLAGYLFLLVPVNWLVFRVMGRVEWAWAMAPVLAVLGTVAVVRMAQLDIGFVRSRTELAVLELQNGYPRGHVSRYAGLYTSLTTDYQLQFPGLSSVAKTFRLNDESSRASRPLNLKLRRGRDTTLEGLQVASNSTGMFQAEEMVSLPGTISARRTGPDRWQLSNATGWDVRDVKLVGRDADGRLLTAELNLLPDQSDLTVGLTRVSNVDQLRVVVADTDTRSGRLEIAEMMRLAAHPDRLAPGEIVLVGWTDQPVPALEVQPAASQNQFRTVIVSHVAAPNTPEPEPDNNWLPELREKADRQLEIDLNALP